MKKAKENMNKLNQELNPDFYYNGVIIEKESTDEKAAAAKLRYISYCNVE